MDLPPLGKPAAESDAEFWARQMQEHAKFLFLLIEDNDLAKRAKSLDLTWEKLRPLLPGKTLPQQASLMASAVFELRVLKTEIIDRQARGEWLGWAWPRFVEHLRAELDYAWRLVTGQKPDDATELCMWLGFMADHAAFAAQLLDPTETGLIQQARGLQHDLSRTGCSCATVPLAPPAAPVSGCQAATLATMVTLSKKAGRQLDHYLKGLTIVEPLPRSTIHPVLGIHVIREGQRFLGTLERLDASDRP